MSNDQMLALLGLLFGAGSIGMQMLKAWADTKQFKLSDDRTMRSELAQRNRDLEHRMEAIDAVIDNWQEKYYTCERTRIALEIRVEILESLAKKHGWEL
jgi:hypothetical protein